MVFEGGGSGHGVGLCQWGAEGMARAGAAAGDILKTYYPGAALGRRMASTSAWSASFA